MVQAGSMKTQELHKLGGLLHSRALSGRRSKAPRLSANPGCYPTSIALGLCPAAESRDHRTPDTIVIDSKSGVTGAGRGLSQTTHYPDCNEAFSPYKIASHRHTPEIEQTISQIVGRDVYVTFVPHLLPVNRGIVSTIYANVEDATVPQGAS